ncbi:triacylglycerol lipase [Fimicolochytrium jonesii]|uniref:triacylglycerol lipase n=1 Tax=Fimicolochytrium jonesii TaxID=1396493 RepID=UPI0022FF0CAF|nr:triacylglycerol lipase [Fimicolochytrium jonesii]KAI8817135.1 triacylglycerol lipase [Fimicolochytrium jonesii]
MTRPLLRLRPAPSFQPRMAVIRLSARRHFCTTPARLDLSKGADDVRRKALDSDDWKAPKGTIVLCHGLLGFDVMGPPFARLHYWRGVKEALNAIGCNVIITKVPRAADVTVRAQVLKETLDSKVPEGDAVNLVAHSMGGLDCRYMISHLMKGEEEPKYRVKSLTTIGTPHRGSSIASLPFISTLLAPIIENLHRSTSLDVRAFSDLTPKYLNEQFNPTTPDNPDIAYFSYGADGTESIYEKPFVYPLRYTFEYLMVTEGVNDGLVSVESSKWGEYIRTLKADHVDVINLWNAWQWDSVVKKLGAAKAAQDNIQALQPDGVARTIAGGAVQRAEEKAEQKVEEKKEDLKKVMVEKQFNAIELYLEVATTLARKGF